MHNTLASAQHFFLVDAKRRQEVWIEIYGYVLKFHSRFGVRFPFLLSENSSVS